MHRASALFSFGCSRPLLPHLSPVVAACSTWHPSPLADLHRIIRATAQDVHADWLFAPQIGRVSNIPTRERPQRDCYLQPRTLPDR
eukprot:7119952-Pyramimonas_sp.AAC.1